ncbi:ABC transporter substrate-binding protein [Myroides sp. LJL116]
MKFLHYTLVVSALALFFVSCEKKITVPTQDNHSHEQFENQVLYAKGFSLRNYPEFSILNVSQPWQGANQDFTYVLYKDITKIPDSLKSYTGIQIPIKNIVATSTTHLPGIELLGQSSSLVGFPGLDYISSENFRTLIDNNKIKELGANESLNTELVLDLNPDVLVAFTMDSGNKVLQTIKQSGIPVLYNGDWVEQQALGKAEWIKVFGALYDQQDKASRLFNQIEADYKEVLSTLKEVSSYPTVLSGAMYQDVWYLPQGQSWAAEFFKDAKADYLWKDSVGSGSLALGFEAVLDKGKDAEFWINPGAFETLKQMQEANGHYANFAAFKNAKVYSFALTKGKNGGTVFYELGPARPDLVLKDLAAIFHPELFPDYTPIFYKQLPYE